MQLACGAFLVLALVLPAFANHLATRYTFQQTLYDESDGSYELFWSFNSTTQIISFAVNVSTTGWVGFGISPNGQMPGSDVVIGWVESDGTVQFNDSFANVRDLPSIDRSQDWELLRGGEENGFTVLEFRRPFVTCDTEGDLDIGYDTSRVVWSWNTMEPPQSGNRHQFRGSRSLNLLGGQENGDPPDPENVQFFDLKVNNVEIPNVDTTYWCQGFELPEAVRNQEQYITRISPVLTDHVREYVHHMLLFLCAPSLNEAEIGQSDRCSDVNGNVGRCQQGLLIGAWAVGGEDFVYPENVAYPVGGPGSLTTAIIQIHYDNPDLHANVIDNSGLRFYYTNTSREERAGILYVGHAVIPTMVIPPNAPSYTIAGVCDSSCTQGIASATPQGNITVFANSLHTHLAGHGLTLQHFRFNTGCNVWEELPPIDQNLRYDFNFQQFSHFSREIIVLPGDLIVLKCFYNSVGKDAIITGGESTREEMCLAFPVYYPQIPGLTACASFPQSDAFDEFITNLTNSGVDPEVVNDITNGVPGAINELEWNDEQIEALEDSILNGPYGAFCDNNFQLVDEGLPRLDQCPYEPPDTCNQTPRRGCCERLRDGAPSLFSFMSATLIVMGVIAAAAF